MGSVCLADRTHASKTDTHTHTHICQQSHGPQNNTLRADGAYCCVAGVCHQYQCEYRKQHIPCHNRTCTYLFLRIHAPTHVHWLIVVIIASTCFNGHSQPAVPLIRKNPQKNNTSKQKKGRTPSFVLLFAVSCCGQKNQTKLRTSVPHHLGLFSFGASTA